MTLSFDASADFAHLVDGLESVTLQRRGSSATSAIAALRAAPTTCEAAPSDGQYTRASTTWHLPQSACPVAPRPGDTLVDAAGNRWTVLEIQASPFTARWKCVCRNLVIQYGLDDTLSVEQSERVSQPGGGYSLVWRTARTGVRARIQPLRTTVQAEIEPPQSVKKYRIYLAEELALDHRHRIRAADGVLHRVTAYTAAAELDSVPTIDTEEVG